MLLAAVLSVFIGLSLGLLGGGGSILTVPLLVYAVGLAPKQAIATSLLVVGTTSAVALLMRLRTGHAGTVRWRIGLAFGSAGMLGAFAGGHIARFIPAPLLLAAFATLMLLTAVALLRGRRETTQPAPAPRRLTGILIEGAAVGLLTGTVGAGGGFLIVPALALLGGLPMPVAVSTSLLVIAMQSLAGFAGYAGHVEIPMALSAVVIGGAVAGALAGSRLGRHVPEAKLRKLFAGFVLVMGVFVIARQLPALVNGSGAAVYDAIFVQRWPFWVTGLAIAAIILAWLRIDNRVLGVSTGCAELCGPARLAVRSWRVQFLLGLLLGGLGAGLLAGYEPTFATTALGALTGTRPALQLPLLVIAGGFIGYGARWAGGCTSGHGIVGVAQGGRASIAATAAFLVGGFATTWLLELAL